ncbi:MAG: hypothetical protein JNL10_17170 [Verrucomicrobiales bacterium]|nr:hypothetical protein [Verrucomicrobiales bacterium]
MKFVLLAILVCSCVLAHCQPFSATTNLAVVDINGDQQSDAVYEAFVANQALPWGIYLNMHPQGTAHFLATPKSIPFLEVDSALDAGTPRYVNFANTGSIALSGYLARRDRQTLIWTFYDDGDEFDASDRLEVFLGLRLLVDDDAHYGWLHMTRPNLKPETIFEVAGSDWNPIANAPIRVGRPPEIPITTEPSPDGTSLRLSWPGGVANWIFESAPSLVPPVVWTEYPAGGTYADVPLDEAERYFRLRRPD